MKNDTSTTSIDAIATGERVARAMLNTPTMPTPAPMPDNRNIGGAGLDGSDPYAARARATVPPGSYRRPTGV